METRGRTAAMYAIAHMPSGVQYIEPELLLLL